MSIFDKFTKDEIDAMSDDYKQALSDVDSISDDASNIKDARFPRDEYGYPITISNYGEHPLNTFGVIKGFL